MSEKINTSTTAGKIKVMQAFEDGKNIQCRVSCEGFWDQVEHPTWDWQLYDYRIAPQPKTRPLRESDWDGLSVVWVRRSNNPRENWMVSAITDKGFGFAGLGSPWADAKKDDLEWSTDRINWKPFTVEEKE